MKNYCLSLMAGLAVCLMSLMPAQSVVVAQSSLPEPAIVVSLAPLSEQMDDIKYLMDSSGYGNLNFLIQSQIKHFTSGIAADRPSGLMFYFEPDNPEPKVLGVVAIDSVDDLLDRIADFADVDEGEDEGDVITVTPNFGQEILLKQVDDYLLIADDAEIFELAPSSPKNELGDLPTKYNLAAQVFGQRIPAELREQAVELIRDGYGRQLEQLGEADEEVMKAQMAQIDSYINETDKLLIGLAADEEGEKLTVEMTLQGLEGSELAKRCQAMANMKPGKFTGFLDPTAAVNANVQAVIIDEDVAMYSSLIDQAQTSIIEELDADGEFSDEELEKIRSFTKTVGEVLKETLADKVLDAGGVLMMEEGKFNFAAGTILKDPAKLEAAIQDVIAVFEEKANGVIEAKLNMDTVDGINLHGIDINIPEDEEEAISILGEKLKLIVGIGKDTVYFAGGKDPVATLTNAIEKSKTVTASEYGTNVYNIYVEPILQYASGITSKDALKKMAGVLKENSKDRLTAYSKIIPNGIESHLEIQDGLMELIKVGVELAQQGAFQGGDFDEF